MPLKQGGYLYVSYANVAELLVVGLTEVGAALLMLVGCAVKIQSTPV